MYIYTYIYIYIRMYRCLYIYIRMYICIYICIQVPVSKLLDGQKMSLPTVNQGNHIYCIDGWFDMLHDAAAGSASAAMSPTKTPGKSQIHLRMTYIPSVGTKMYMYMYVYMYVCMYLCSIYIYVQESNTLVHELCAICRYAAVFIYVCLYVTIYIRICIYIYVFM